MTKKDNTTPDLVKDADDKNNRDYILQDNKKTKFGATFIIVTLVILILAVIATSYFIG
ncbi:hypothetical protein ULMS_12130 [Patiriisocius marinistellae]|uniref:Uncharacterized protein n=1 Tax=Patiriisocius marinistellae TaxID=2494560 RepID=A0A5J4G053_9FLAO|nr:hypothetical protein [Patiriisocius marinistellae]GEQ85705.1 hypothetical protein ULMS_12130 [Patiriisocius marinistellae]